MPERIITIKGSGPSKKYPDKFGWVLDEETEKFHNVSRAEADSAIKGAKYKQTYHINQKGYEQTDALVPLDGAPTPETFGHNPRRSVTNVHAASNGNRDRHIFMCGVLNNWARAGKLPVDADQIEIAIRQAFRGYDQALNPNLVADDIGDTF